MRVLRDIIGIMLKKRGDVLSKRLLYKKIRTSSKQYQCPIPFRVMTLSGESPPPEMVSTAMCSPEVVGR